MGYDLGHGHAAQVMSEIARVVPSYKGISFARLERGGMSVPNGGFGDAGTKILSTGEGQLSPVLVPVIPAARAFRADMI
jgi:predicted molibdopterin-dependent oxidoreductase YjgC